MNPIKEMRRKRQAREDADSEQPTGQRRRDHRDRLSYERRSEGDEVLSPPKLIPSRSRWASSPNFIRSGSMIFDEVFRLGMGVPAGVACGYGLLDLRRIAEAQTEAGATGLAAIGGFAGFFAISFFLCMPICIVWGFWRQAQCKAARKKRISPPEPLRWLGTSSLLVGFVVYLFARTYLGISG